MNTTETDMNRLSIVQRKAFSAMVACGIPDAEALKLVGYAKQHEMKSIAKVFKEWKDEQERQS